MGCCEVAAALGSRDRKRMAISFVGRPAVGSKAPYVMPVPVPLGMRANCWMGNTVEPRLTSIFAGSPVFHWFTTKTAKHTPSTSCVVSISTA